MCPGRTRHASAGRVGDDDPECGCCGDLWGFFGLTQQNWQLGWEHSSTPETMEVGFYRVGLSIKRFCPKIQLGPVEWDHQRMAQSLGRQLFLLSADVRLPWNPTCRAEKQESIEFPDRHDKLKKDCFRMIVIVPRRKEKQETGVIFK